MMKPHLEFDERENGLVGRDPRKLSIAELERMNRPKITRADAIREKCIDCCAGSPGEVRKCTMIDCALWPFRMGTNPYRSEMSPEDRKAAKKRMAEARAAKEK